MSMCTQHNKGLGRVMRKLLILLTVLLVAAPLSAQWRRAGLFGADVRALIVHPDNPDKLYLGTSGGDVYVSSDGAKSWINPRYGIPFPNYVVDNLIVDAKGQLWAASWGLWGGGVIAVSSDEGKTWERRDSGLEEFSIRALAIDPNDEKFLVAGGLTGVYRSRDAGRTWQKISDQIHVGSLAIDPRSQDRIYVGTWRQGWRTDDGGRNWKHIANGMVLDTDMFTITIDPAKPDNVWVATCGWVYNSQNAGDQWTRYKDGFNNRRIHDVKIDPSNRNIVYAGSVAGLYRSDNGGKLFSVISDESLVINSIVLHPARPKRIVLGVEGDGVYLSNDQGKTYQRSSIGLHNLRITTIAPDPLVKNRLYGAVASGGAASGVYRSDDGGTSWEKTSRTALPEVLSLTVAMERDAEVKFIAGTEKGFFWSSDGIEWTQAIPSAFPIRVDKVLRFNSQRSFAATAEGVFTTRDSGKNWYRLGNEAGNRAVDLAVGNLDGRRALFALTATGIDAFDGSRWIPISEAPARGRSIAIRSSGGSEVIYVAGVQGVRAGSIDQTRRWIPAHTPDTQFAAVHGATRDGSQMLFLTSRNQREILIGEPSSHEWSEIALPIRNTEITSVIADPFSGTRFYVGTLGDGIYIYEGLTRRFVTADQQPKPVIAPGGGG
jgi:photosystem II stability/assembly factor-like uncharacterized protein